MKGVPPEQLSPPEPHPLTQHCSAHGQAQRPKDWSCWDPNCCSGASSDTGAVVLPIHPGVGWPQAGIELMGEI